MKAMISQPMNGLTSDEILETRVKALKWLKDNNYDFVDALYHNSWYSTALFPKIGTENYPLFQLSRYLEQMSKCDAVYFCKGWENYRCCKIEHEAAEAYGLKIIEEV